MVHSYERYGHISTDRFGTTLLVKRDGQWLHVMKTIDLGRFGRKSKLIAEVEELARLEHPHLVSVRECFLEDSVLCIITDYAAGGHAAMMVAKARETGLNLGENLYLKWFAQAALALAYMHEKQTVHRDLRTRRLLLTASGHVVVSGGALSMLHADMLSLESMDLEAIRYLSPELVAGEATHCAATDLWALGVILFEMSALRPPFDDPHPRGLAERILGVVAPPPLANCSSEVHQLCSSLMRREPEARITAAASLSGPAVQSRLRALFNEETERNFGVGLTDEPRRFGYATATCIAATVSSPSAPPIKAMSGSCTTRLLPQPSPLLLRVPVQPPRALRPPTFRGRAQLCKEVPITLRRRVVVEHEDWASCSAGGFNSARSTIPCSSSPSSRNPSGLPSPPPVSPGGGSIGDGSSSSRRSKLRGFTVVTSEEICLPRIQKVRSSSVEQRRVVSSRDSQAASRAISASTVSDTGESRRSLAAPMQLSAEDLRILDDNLGHSVLSCSHRQACSRPSRVSLVALKTARKTCTAVGSCCSGGGSGRWNMPPPKHVREFPTY
eukprot:TRINITY_DN70461_c0_g1_i1.p1 TRINITY_DN70461_c0_g1~~TRINITY_DN70461_c0_g1_i1.p1  ORF type:complete len:563 (+),score=100.59 TRINITY_DN70461_c0_g1_i1:23-1690(+)